jgi:pimeloyl-ACP methyl ester carboxylesterase
MRRARALAVGLVVLVMLVAGAGAATTFLLDQGGDPQIPPHTPSPSGSPSPMPATDPKLAAYYDQQLDWQTCDDDNNQCATMQVPVDYAHPDGQTLDLALLKVPAAEPDQKVGSLVVNPGGPGVPATSYAAAGDSYWGDPLLAHFDIVGLDPRGTGESAAVDCLPDDQLDAYLASDPDPDTATEVAESQRETRDFGAGCVANSGALASHVSTVEAAMDMDILRAVLGEPRLDYFGASYGTELGATYAELFPKRIGRMVLDGAVDLSIGPRDSAIQQAVGFETALRAYVANCVDSGSCFLGATVDEGITRIQQFLSDVDAHPLPTQGDRELTVGNAVYGIITPLYERQYWNLLTLSLRQAFGGDGSSLLLLADAYAMRNPNGTYASSLVEANYDINCLDDPTSIPMSQVPDEIPAFEKASPTFGAIFAYGLTTCSGFTPRSTVPVPHNAAEGAPPLLVIGTTRDPATPLRWAVALAKQLSSAILVTRDGDGHTGYHSENPCVDATVEDYLIDGTVPAADVDCPAP